MNPASSGWQRRDARTEYERHHRGPNMTPMVDVVMVILIFFMASTVILGPEMLLAAGLEASKPPATDSDPRFAIDRPSFEIRIDAIEGRPAFTGLGLTDAPLDQLSAAARALAAEAGTGSVRMIIAPDDAVAYESVVALQDLLRDAGFRSIGLR